MSFTRACEHLTNYTVGHESRWRYPYATRFDYPDNHIEVDNRLAWFLGAMDKQFGKEARYVHLKRDFEATAESYAARWSNQRGIVKHFGLGIHQAKGQQPIDVARDMVSTINDNISAFLRDKPHRMEVHLESIATDFPVFLSWIGAEGDFSAALSEWENRHNARRPVEPDGAPLGSLSPQIAGDAASED